jgi:type IV pilus assembly protein PilC
MKGESQSKSANLVRAELRKQGITPTVVKEKKKPLFGSAGKRISALEIATFSRQIDTMLQSACRWCRASRSCPAARERAHARHADDIRDSISGGSSLYEALGRHPLQFDDLYRNLVKAGEGAGVLDTVLDTLAPTRNASRP